jgi:putative transposase
LQGEGLTIQQTCKRLGISDQTFYAGAPATGRSRDEAHRLRALDQENSRLKKIGAEQALEISFLEGHTAGNW